MEFGLVLGFTVAGQTPISSLRAKLNAHSLPPAGVVSSMVFCLAVSDMGNSFLPTITNVSFLITTVNQVM